MIPSMAPTVFLLSPANMNGLRARQLVSPRASFSAALAFRNGGVAIAEAFAFMSALYFRGKIAYAKHFAAPPPGLPGSGVLVIAPGYGLVPPDFALNEETIKKIKRTKVDPKKPSYRRPLETHARQVAAAITEDTRVVLLGSIATGKYVDVLWPIFGDRFLFPSSFVGIGDMSRGSIMLKAATSGVELEYSTLHVERHRKRQAGVTMTRA